MIKYLKYLVVLFSVLILVFVFFEPTKEVKVLTFNHNTIQNIKNNEIVRVPLLINKDDSYITNIDLIENVNLKNDDYLIPVDLINIKLEKYLVNYNNQDYYAFMFDLVLNQENPEFQMNDAMMSIKYQDGNSKSYKIGNVSITSNNVKDFNIFYLDSNNSQLGDIYTVDSVIVGITNTSSKELLIKDFNIDLDDVSIDNSKIIISDDLVITKNEDIKLYPTKNTSELNYYLEPFESKYFVLPLKYQEKEYLYRFYINIDTTDNVDTIDDFLFLNQGYFPYFMFEEVNSYDD